MKTLMWTGSACGLSHLGQSRLWRWWYHYQPWQDVLGVTHWAAFNNGAGNLPVEPFVQFWDAVGDIEFEQNKLNFVYWDNLIPTSETWHGIYRSYVKSAQICQEQDFDRFIYIEADAFIFNPSMMEEIGKTTKGAVTYWCDFHHFPEASFCIIDRDHFKPFEDFASFLLHKDCSDRSPCFESDFKWTEVRKNRFGDRWGERLHPVPANADFACQIANCLIIRQGGKIVSL